MLHYHSVLAGVDEESVTCTSSEEEEEDGMEVGEVGEEDGMEVDEDGEERDELDEDGEVNETTDEDMGVTGRKKVYHHTVLAATGKEARRLQLKAIEEDAATSQAHGRDPDPYGYAPYNTKIGSPEFAEHFLVLKDGTNIARSAGIRGRSTAANKAQLANQAKIGVFNKNAALARRIPNADGLTPIMRDEHDQRGILLAQAVDTVMDPRTIKNDGLLNTYRWGVCAACGEVVVGTSRNSKHACSSTRDTTMLTAEIFASLERIVFAHNILDNPVLFALLGTEGPKIRSKMSCKSVADVLADLENIQDLQNSLPHDHHLLRPANCQSLVYLPRSLRKDKGLWVTLAVEALLQEQSQCPQAFDVVTAEQRNAWSKQGKAMVDWNADCTRELFVFFCSSGGNHGVVLTVKKVKNSGRRWFLHICDHGHDAIKQHRAANGNTSYPTGYINTILDLPAHYSSFLWLQLRLDL
ncbi:hypothetical protein C8R44DRAFT_890922 [Mycena epipterygia]|nr:hypothetical protein C8R44DRAFT_890922 [Mycena epipterygia]